mmetsp:Transcript_4738/g.5857  ORF Transcript_4738/g.5857 Transcript_4738/m.5857 type:complete len:103 (-) Transcript_4738:571-879(-)
MVQRERTWSFLDAQIGQTEAKMFTTVEDMIHVELWFLSNSTTYTVFVTPLLVTETAFTSALKLAASNMPRIIPALKLAQLSLPSSSRGSDRYLLVNGSFSYM